jgi:SAM-dependent methyltransferase
LSSEILRAFRHSPVSKETYRRLYPSITDPNYLVLRSRRMIFASWANQLQKKGLTVLDIGGRYQPYRPLFNGHVSRYFAVDLIKTEFVSVVADGQALPFAPETFDIAIATQVFEFFQDPYLAAKQIHRVLKPGGMLLASVAQCVPRIRQDERWRFTPTGIRSVLAPFATVEIVPEVYSLGGLIRTVNLGFSHFVRYESARKIYGFTVCPILNLVGQGLEKLNLTANDQFTANYSLRALKAQ